MGYLRTLPRRATPPLDVLSQALGHLVPSGLHIRPVIRRHIAIPVIICKNEQEIRRGRFQDTRESEDGKKEAFHTGTTATL